MMNWAFLLPSLREKGRMRGCKIRQLAFIYPLSPTLSRRERELTGQQCKYTLIRARRLH
jgi:hypothetical protein